jgi:sulfate transport system substrate-binding protein
MSRAILAFTLILSAAATASVLARYHAQFPDIRLASIGELGGWESVSKTHFADGGVLDQLLAARR